MKEKDPERVRLGKMAKGKGSKYERDVAKLLSKSFNAGEFMKTPRSGGISGTLYKTMKQLGRACCLDLIVPQWFMFSIDTKNSQDWSFDDFFWIRKRKKKKKEQMFNEADYYFEPVLIEWFKEAEMKCKKLGAKPPILIFTKNRMSDFVLLSSEYCGWSQETRKLTKHIFWWKEYIVVHLDYFILAYKCGYFEIDNKISKIPKQPIEGN